MREEYNNAEIHFDKAINLDKQKILSSSAYLGKAWLEIIYQKSEYKNNA